MNNKQTDSTIQALDIIICQSFILSSDTNSLSYLSHKTAVFFMFECVNHYDSKEPVKKCCNHLTTTRWFLTIHYFLELLTIVDKKDQRGFGLFCIPCTVERLYLSKSCVVESIIVSPFFTAFSIKPVSNNTVVILAQTRNFLFNQFGLFFNF